MNIVLVHGMPGFGVKFGIDYFNGVKDRLAEPTTKVLVTDGSYIASIAKRGEDLRAQLLEVFTSGTLDRNEKTHIIAHSQGGLAARYMLSPANANPSPGNIVSLTTIASPHEGSPIADLLSLDPVDRWFGNLEAFVRHPRLAEGLVQELLNSLGIDPNALTDLTTEQMKKFNAQYVDNNNVRYFSVAGAGRSRKPQTSRALLLFHLYMESLNGQPNDKANDGLVTVSSAQRWQADSQIWPTDHADEVGHDLDSPNPKAPPSFDYLGAYEAIVNRVSSI